MPRSGYVIYVAYLLKLKKFTKGEDWDEMSIKLKGNNHKVKGFTTVAESNLWVEKIATLYKLQEVEYITL